MTTGAKNWAGNVVFSAEHLEAPTSVERVREVVADADKAHVVGAGHSFSRIADTTGTLISLRNLPPTVEVSRDRTSARISGGLRLAETATALDAEGLALHNLPSLPHITVVGAVATATHGSGDGNGSLASAVRSLDLVTADGKLTTLSRGDARFDGVVASFGSLGVVTGVELDVVPAFEVEQRVYDDLPWSVLVERSAELFAQAYSVSVFTDWRDSFTPWVKRRTSDAPADLGWTGAREATSGRHPIPGVSAEHCTPQLGEPGPWHARLPHFRAEFTPSSGDELQSEYVVPREHAAESLRALKELGSVISPVLQVSEIRTVAADEHWLSPFYRRDGMAFHFTWVPDAHAVRPVLTLIEEALAPYSVRPHFGKLHETAPADRYEHWARFAGLLSDLDPFGKFRNEVVDHYFPR
ncbi:FAD-binding protein [Umezawaea endophytica]|uniref:FAD-binding protein n=1 Tax=Umezawaea endophytica TaxID=1654476 RepID=A0A9X2VR68_9PSEU|nr:FAD-binding protein [Umezawaea endophytica]MCS7480682.1 FAD-binding protein [Umezawaea endophytica]